MAHRAKLTLITLMLFVTLSFSLERQAHAYVDPGSSLLLFQSFSAIVSGVLFYFRRRIKTLFTRTGKPETSTAPIVSSSVSVSEPR
jgi:hypothetical protein